jgi:hypothetical protein
VTSVESVEAVPVPIVSGAVGVGKTTVAWAVLAAGW